MNIEMALDKENSENIKLLLVRLKDMCYEHRHRICR